MVCGYCQDVGKASQGLKPPANNTAWAKQKDGEKHTQNKRWQEMFFHCEEYSCNACGEKKKLRHSPCWTDIYISRSHFLHQSLHPSPFSCSLRATVIWSCHKQIPLADLSKCQVFVKLHDGLQESDPRKLLSRKKERKKNNRKKKQQSSSTYAYLWAFTNSLLAELPEQGWDWATDLTVAWLHILQVLLGFCARSVSQLRKY